MTKAIYDGVVDRDERRALKRMFNRARQVIETVGTWVCDRFGVKRPRARSYWGLLTRIAAAPWAKVAGTCASGSRLTEGAP